MNNEKINMREIAAEYDLQFVETTDQRDGYPSNIMGAIIGMESFELAEELAAKYNLDIELITKHDGWQLWYRTGDWMNEPLMMPMVSLQMKSSRCSRTATTLTMHKTSSPRAKSSTMHSTCWAKMMQC